MDNLSDFYLAGHSFGAYLIGNYALEYSQHIRKILLISPIGVVSENEYNKSEVKIQVK